MVRLEMAQFLIEKGNKFPRHLDDKMVKLLVVVFCG